MVGSRAYMNMKKGTDGSTEAPASASNDDNLARLRQRRRRRVNGRVHVSVHLIGELHRGDEVVRRQAGEVHVWFIVEPFNLKAGRILNEQVSGTVS